MSKYYNWKNGINEEELNEVVEILNNNGIIIFPTETVYGIGGNAFSEDVVNRIYSVKKRPREKALNIILPSADKIEEYAEITSEKERKIINTYMPGPITIILNKKSGIGSGFTQSDNTIGIRVPDHKITNAILSSIDFPLIAPSANISGMPSAVKVEDIINDFNGKVDAIIDGGMANFGVCSTIVKVENNEVKVLRSGAVKVID